MAQCIMHGKKGGGGLKTASGTFTAGVAETTIAGLSFRPKMIHLWPKSSNPYPSTLMFTAWEIDGTLYATRVTRSSTGGYGVTFLSSPSEQIEINNDGFTLKDYFSYDYYCENWAVFG